jgi:hypothetical protein
LTATLFLVKPIRSQSGAFPYDPWADANDDGVIDGGDLAYTARMFGTAGDPINKTALLLELESRVDSLNSSLLTLEAYLTTRITTLEATVAQQQSTMANLETELAVLNTTKLGKPDYDSGWTAIAQGTNKHFNHGLGTTDILVYVIGKNGGSGINQLFYGLDYNSYDAVQGLCWWNLDTNGIDVIRGINDATYAQVRVMLWKIPQP